MSTTPTSQLPDATSLLGEAYSPSAARIQTMSEGLSTLRIWLTDLLRQGLADLTVLPHTYWESRAKRMVDAKLPSIARMLRSIPGIINEDVNWPEEVLSRIGYLYALTTSFDRLDEMPPMLRADLLAACGVKVQQKELDALPGIRDIWFVLSVIETDSESLTFRTTWMLGTKTGQMGMILDFAFGFNRFDQSWTKGAFYEGETVFHPGYRARRMVVRGELSITKAPVAFMGPPSGFADLGKLQTYWTETLATAPWTPSIPVIIQDIQLVNRKTEFIAKDFTGKSLPIKCERKPVSQAIERHSGNLLTILGEVDEKGLLPIAFWNAGNPILF